MGREKFKGEDNVIKSICHQLKPFKTSLLMGLLSIILFADVWFHKFYIGDVMIFSLLPFGIIWLVGFFCAGLTLSMINHKKHEAKMKQKIGKYMVLLSVIMASLTFILFNYELIGDYLSVALVLMTVMLSLLTLIILLSTGNPTLFFVPFVVMGLLMCNYIRTECMEEKEYDEYGEYSKYDGYDDYNGYDKYDDYNEVYDSDDSDSIYNYGMYSPHHENYDNLDYTTKDHNGYKKYY